MTRSDSQNHAKGISMSVLVCMAISLSFFPLAISAEAAQKNPQPLIQRPISVPQEVTSPLADIASGVKLISHQLPEKSRYPSWLVVFGPWFVGFCALLIAFALNFIVPWYNKPILKAVFEKDKPEYASDLLFEEMEPQFIDPLLGNKPFNLRQPGFNTRVKVINKGRSIARNVQARIESIKCYNKSKEFISEIWYHPSIVKWSGEKEYNKIDIAPNCSYFFLDLVYCINETYSEIAKRYSARWHFLQGLTNPMDYSGDVYWAVWVDRNYSRGIPMEYRDEGYFELNYHLMAENCKPIKFTAYMNWEKSSWNKPEISIEQRGW